MPPTTVDLAALYAGSNQLLRVFEVAEQLGVCNATVYRLCENGELPHVRTTVANATPSPIPGRGRCAAAGFWT